MQEEWVICRIVFNKSGEKKNGSLLLQGQRCLFDDAPPPPGPATKTSLLECQSQIQNPMENLHNIFVIQQQQENHHHNLFPVNGLYETSTTSSNKNIMINNSSNNNTSPSVVFKSLLLSHQDFSSSSSVELATIPKPCKTEEANFSHFQLPPPPPPPSVDNNNNLSNCCWMDDNKIQQNYYTYPSPLFFDLDCSFPGGLTTQASAAAVNNMSTSVSFNRTGGLQVIESWPLDA